MAKKQEKKPDIELTKMVRKGTRSGEGHSGQEMSDEDGDRILYLLKQFLSFFKWEDQFYSFVERKLRKAIEAIRKWDLPFDWDEKIADFIDDKCFDALKKWWESI